MELGEGGDLLEKLLADGQPMTEEHVCTKIAVPLLIALKHLHELHIIHRWVTGSDSDSDSSYHCSMS